MSSDNADDWDFSRLFRDEALVSQADLRVEVADEMSRLVNGDESVSLDRKEVHARGHMMVTRGSRDRHVEGKYYRWMNTNKGKRSETFAIQSHLEERVEGGVWLLAELESEVIMGGAYVNTIAGPFLRAAGWADFLAWGGWMEVDLARVEISQAMIRTSMFIAQLCAARLTMANVLVNDFSQRVEMFGVLNDATVSNVHVGMPGADTINQV